MSSDVLPETDAVGSATGIWLVIWSGVCGADVESEMKKKACRRSEGLEGTDARSPRAMSAARNPRVHGPSTTPKSPLDPCSVPVRNGFVKRTEREVDGQADAV